MLKIQLLKGLAILNFIALFILFLLYRNGSLDGLVSHRSDNYFQSPNGGAEAGIKFDTTKFELDSILRNTASKPPAPLNSLFPDGIRLNPDLDSTYISKQKPKVRSYDMMSGSKSGIIFQPKTTAPSQEKKRKKRE